MVEVLNFAGRTLYASSRGVKSYDSLSLSQSAPTERKVVNKAEQVAQMGVGKGTVTVVVPLLAALGVDVLGETAAWRAIADSGVKGALYVAGRRLDALEWMVTSVGLSNPMAGPGGRVYEGKLTLGFEGSMPPEEALEKASGSGGGNSGGDGKGKGPDAGDVVDFNAVASGLAYNREGALAQLLGQYAPEGSAEYLRWSMAAARSVPEIPKIPTVDIPARGGSNEVFRPD